MLKRTRSRVLNNAFFSRVLGACSKWYTKRAWWEIITLVIGLLSFISLIVILFLPYGAGPTSFTFEGTVPDPTTPAFIEYVSSSLDIPLRTGTPIVPLKNGDAFLSLFLNDIDNAKSSINIMVYIWTEGAMSDQVIAHLDKKLQQGVPVRLLVDAYGSGTHQPNKKFDMLKEHGAKVQIFNSLTIAPWEFLKNRVRNHRRSMVIDGTIAYTGGIAISDPWLGNARNPKEYRDMTYRTTGPLALDLQGAFSQSWTSMTGEILTGEQFFPSSISRSTAAVHDSLKYVSLASIPSPDSLTLQKLLLISFSSARKNIYITSPYFIPDTATADLLIAKAKEGVDVRVLVPNKYNDQLSVRYSSQYSYEKLLAGGVKMYEYQPTFIHTKNITIDGAWSIVGTANMDNRSRAINNEIAVGIYDTAFANAASSSFMSDLEQAEQIKLDEWSKRGLWQRWREIFDRKFVKQY
jgi:cardiolipin synthase